MNIKFNYLYRDAGNYKNFNAIIFSNPKCYELEKIKVDLKNNLIDNMYFVARQLSIPELFFENINSDDHDWHEFIDIEQTADKINDSKNRTIDKFIQDLKSCYKKSNINNN
jgi:hypothetical protein